MATVQAEVLGKVRALGAEGRRWLDGLDGALATLATRWGIEVEATLAGGSEAFVAAVRTRGGEAAVLKLGIPGTDIGREAAVLRRGDRRGYARVLAEDHEHNAVLLERLGPALAGLGFPVDAQLEVIATTLCRAWTAEPDPALPTGADKARWLAGFIGRTWVALRREDGNGFDEVIEHALECCARRESAFDPATAVLAHGDPHASNLLLARGQPVSPRAEFRLIDPDGLFAEPAYDLAIPLREWPAELATADGPRLARERCALLARVTGVAPTPIWEWAAAERVSTGLLMRSVGRQRHGRNLLAAAAAIL